MKNIFSRLISLLLLLCIVIGCVSSCDLIPKPDDGNDEQQGGAPQPKELSPDKERLLDAIQAEEDKTQDKLGDEKKAVIIPGKKNW